MDDIFESRVLSHTDVCGIVRQCMPDLVKKLDLEPVLDHLIAANVLSKDDIVEYEKEKDKHGMTNQQQQQLNRWFLRRKVLTGSNQVIM